VSTCDFDVPAVSRSRVTQLWTTLVRVTNRVMAALTKRFGLPPSGMPVLSASSMRTANTSLRFQAAGG
jgi:hypothetical protein